jgi:hypothetical protein
MGIVTEVKYAILMFFSWLPVIIAVGIVENSMLKDIVNYRN